MQLRFLPTFFTARPVSTGALVGRVLDPTGALVRGANVALINRGSGNSHSCKSDEGGNFYFALLPPGNYNLSISRTGFVHLNVPNVNILVTETSQIDLHLEVGSVTETVEVSSDASLIRSNTIASGRVVNQTAVIGLPLVTRNFAQIADLSPGVATGVSNAGRAWCWRNGPFPDRQVK